MLITAKTRDFLFRMFAVLICFVSAYHLLGVFYKVDNASVQRHIIFFFINCFCVYGVLKRPAYFVFLLALLLIQQYYSHGIYLIKLWHEKKLIHWTSICILLLLPIILVCLVEDFIVKRREIKKHK